MYFTVHFVVEYLWVKWSVFASPSLPGEVILRKVSEQGDDEERFIFLMAQNY